MKINRAYKTELDPNKKQITAFRQAAGCARWAYNWGLKRKIEAYEIRKTAIASGVAKADAPKVPTAIDLHKELVILKKTPQDQGGVPWMYETTKSAPQEALRNLDKAFGGFFRRCKEGKAGPKGFPNFKSRKQGIGNFSLEAYATKTHVVLTKLRKIKLKEKGYLPTKKTLGIHTLGATVSEQAGKWFVSLKVEEELPEPTNKTNLPVVGVDVGIKTLATCSDGIRFENPQALRKGTIKLKKLQRSLNRKVKGSSNRKKAKEKLANQHFKISNIRKNALHQCSNAITKRASVIILEDLNVVGMLKNHRLAGALSDAAVSELHRQIRYKASWKGVTVQTADRWFPSSKKCSGCGHIKTKLLLSERVFRCEACGLVIDRDLNASVNLKNLAVSSTVAVCGEESSGLDVVVQTKLSSVKQKPSTKRLPPGSV
jgi:putative transposase